MQPDAARPRIATLVLCTSAGRVLGVLPPFQPELPWWQDAEGLVRSARKTHGVEVTILRLLDAALPSPPGGPVTYLAEIDEESAAGLALAAWTGELDHHPLRLTYAEPGGPDRDLAWAAAALDQQGIRQSGAPQQVRTWNLSSLWRIPVDEENVWLKCVPPFFGHEGAVVRLLGDAPVPRLVAHEGNRILMREIPGEDLYGAPVPVLLSLVSMLVALQAEWAARVDELLALGLPDWRGAALHEAVEDVVRRNSHQLTNDDRGTLDELVEGMSQRFVAIDECGIPNTLVHGDFAPGNARGDDSHQVLLDWGDCGIGHPLLDRAAFLDRIPQAQIAEVETHWDHLWRRVLPGSDPTRAAGLLAPLAAARQAVIYQLFLDSIEPSEHPYHRGDPAEWLSRAAALTRIGTSP